MSNNYFSFLTNAGMNKLAQKHATGERVALAQMGVSDFDGEIKEDFTALPGEKHRFNINTIEFSKSEANTLICEGVIASEIGGFYVRKVGIYTDDGVLFALGNLPPSYKPLPSDGSTKEISIKVYLQFSNTANITLKVDNSTMPASKEHVERKIKELNAVLEKRIQDNELFKILISIRELRRELEQ
ncbi:MAG: phage tail protein, partial [Wolinella sp.]